MDRDDVLSIYLFLLDKFVDLSVEGHIEVVSTRVLEMLGNDLCHVMPFLIVELVLSKYIE